MADEIQMKKSLIWVVLAILVIGGFVFFALKNVLSKDDVGTELVRGEEFGSNKMYIDGDVQVINLGIANYNYDPDVITVEANKPVKIIGNMQQLQGCLRAFSIPQLGISKVFRANDNVIEFTPTEKGRYGFTCSMGMGRGTLIVE